jgi:hypothetical protein
VPPAGGILVSLFLIKRALQGSPEADSLRRADRPNGYGAFWRRGGALSQRSGEPDPYPWTWEIPLAIVLAVLVLISIGVHLGRESPTFLRVLIGCFRVGSICSVACRLSAQRRGRWSG